MWKEDGKVKFVGADWKEYIRTKCEVWSRVMWYLRPVSWYNIWKKQEHKDRVFFKESKIDNSLFLRKYA